METDTTYVIELTPAGRAAVAVVLVTGPRAISAVSNRFKPAGNRTLTDTSIGQIMVGRWSAGGEELVVCRRAENQVEVQCHGGIAAVRAVLDGLIEVGCRSMQWHDWVRLSSPDPIQAAAQIALAEAITARTAAILLDQYNGALARAIRAVIAAIEPADWSRAVEAIDELLGRRDLGLHLVAPWRVVLAGAPNVGKSSLINALAGYERAIVSPQPGTTRDVVALTTAIDGWPVQLADTAGLRESADPLESAGVELARSAAAGADMLIIVHDATQRTGDSIGDESDFSTFLAKLSPVVRVLHVVNKIDLVSGNKRARATVFPSASGSNDEKHWQGQWRPISTSALTGAGTADLAAAIGQLLVPSAPLAGCAVPFTAQQFATLATARDAMQRGDGPAAIATLQSLLAACRIKG